MSSLAAIYFEQLSLLPTWSLSSCDVALRDILGSLKVNDLQPHVERRMNKHSLVNQIILAMRSTQYSFQGNQNCYLDTCRAFEQRFGPVLYRCLIQSLTLEVDLDREPLPYANSNFLPALRLAFSACPPDDLDRLLTALPVKKTNKDGSVLHRLNAPDGAGVIHNSRPFYNAFDLVFAVLEGRGYPYSVLNAATVALKSYNAKSLMGLPVPGSSNDRRRTERKEARIARVADELNALEDAKLTWPQPIPHETIMDCLCTYRDAIQYIPLSVCASCGAEDRLRSGSSCSLASLPSVGPGRGLSGIAALAALRISQMARKQTGSKRQL
ncbi:hypothetical protein BT96DRAFT_1002983 [Gymnopus androsaceus JB14]|uniref:Uncharacterized protein n=1 Tax=Gymnopus androsaceus JB14 TaxID=1447944 RepID=A0A6A4GXH1_9AGAR|nr:hypothetical protein BT96DRAFT_1002983 [Gymnopus androsaceus JB14]